MIWQEDLDRIALLHFKYKMFVFLEDDFGMPGQASKILKAPVEKLQKKKQINEVAVGCNARAAGHAPTDQGCRGLSVEMGRRGNILARGRVGRAHADPSGQHRASAHTKNLRRTRSHGRNHMLQ